MYVVCVTLFVKPEFVDPFIEASRDNAMHTRKEPNNVRFDLLRDIEDPTRFFLYEAYQAPEDFAAHQKTEHYARWNARVAEYMKVPRTRTKNQSLFFGDGE